MDSPFSEYLDSGYSPSDAEIPLIKALIQQKIDVISSIDKEYEEILDSVAALKARRKANKIFIQKHQALIAPIKRLPPDILSTVFLASLPVIECTEAAMTCNHPAVVISQVCRHWRQLAFDTPLLWSRIQLILPNVNPYYPPDDVDRVNGETAALFDSVVQRLSDATTIWLSRSKGCPLTILMKASESAAGGLDTSQSKTLEGSVLMGLGKLVGLLSSESKRWEQVRFELAIIGDSRKSQLSRLLFLAPRDVPILRRTSIVINSVDFLEVPISLSVGSEHTNFWDGIAMSTIHGQALRSLTLACPKNATKLKGLQVNWDGLTELSLRPYALSMGQKGGTHFTADEALTLLRLCPNLKRCNLAIGNGFLTSDWDTSSPVWYPSTTPLAVALVQDDRPLCRLPHLQSLILREDSGRTDSLASALDLPSLRSFTQINPVQWSMPLPVGMPASYLDHEDGRARNVIPLVEWVQRFGHTITSIDIEHAGVPQHDVEKCLEDLPNLISLTIRSPFSESWNTTLSWSGSACDSFLERLTPEVTEDGDAVTVSPGCLCPKLEDLALNSFSNSAPVQLMFNEASVLEFLTGRAKASLKTVPEVSRVSKLRYVSMGLVGQKVVDIEQELSRRGCNIEGFVGVWNYPDPPAPLLYLQTPHIGDFAMDEFSTLSNSYRY
ncbi:hypothetical protein EST38_g2800 [Candolleomyces aberdarensis]|uniref:Uncharacterized protein n=1 Tax=Candolleomyces aberdarensis TaxID=2316362 RepID=A0A4Q2DTQ3_9AGAR|nr:hypothetical protein EST38_g2800 [Candolleomyces aberdarensis]